MNGASWVMTLVAAVGVVVLTFALGPFVAAYLRVRWRDRRRR